MDNNDMTPEMNDPDNLDGDETDGTTADQRDSADEIPTSDQAAAFDETAEYTEDQPAYENLTTGPTSYQSGLVRDPYATFGGVISGIAHRYGWDVALTRLGFLATVILTGGSALLLYVFAWLIVPRATYWPPNERVKRSGLTSRELGFGLAAAGILIYLAVGTGGFGQAVVPLALVGGGVWMLLQNPRPESAELAATPTMAMAGANAPPVDVYQPIGSASPPPPIGEPPTGGPVVPRRRRRRWIVGIVLALLAVLLTIVIGIVVLVATGHSDFGDTNTIRMTPTSVEALPIVIKEDAAEVLLDLTQLDSDDFDDLDAPALVDIRLDAGSIRVIVPSDLAIEVDAKVNIGQVVIDQESDSGFDSRLSVRDANPDVTIEIDLDVGEIIVDRLSATQALLEVR